MGSDLNKNFFLCKFKDNFKCAAYTTNKGQIQNALVNPYNSNQIYSYTTKSVFKVNRY